MNFTEKLRQSVQQSGSVLCVGLDPNLDRLPAPVKEHHPTPVQQVAFFCKRVIDATRDNCCAYKPNLAFFEALGAPGLDVFQEVINYIPSSKIIIADAKRGDIDSTARHYKKAYFDTFDVDALTVNPLMGFETLAPFLHETNKAIFVLALTSNPGANDLLEQPLGEFDMVAQYIADRLDVMNQQSEVHLGMVIGATRKQQARSVLQFHNKAHLLIPGIGTQGGKIEDLHQVLENHKGIPIISSSRSIIYAGGDDINWQQLVEEQSSKVKQQLQPLTQSYV